MPAPRRKPLKKNPGSLRRSDGGQGPTFPRADYISDTPYSQLPKAERKVWMSRAKKDIGILAAPGAAFLGFGAAISDAMGGRKNLQYKKSRVKVTRQTGK